MEKLFTHCGQLQQETGIFAAGDLSKTPLRTLTQHASENLRDVNLCGVRHEEQRDPVVASHAVPRNAVMICNDIDEFDVSLYFFFERNFSALSLFLCGWFVFEISLLYLYSYLF